MRTFQYFACLFLFCVVAFAQSDRGTITGTINDPAGAVVAAAAVDARNVETGAVYQAASSATGNYTLSFERAQCGFGFQLAEGAESGRKRRYQLSNAGSQPDQRCV